MRVCHNKSCPNHSDAQTGRTYEDLSEIALWARENADDPFALGALATINYMLFLDSKTPKERFMDADAILKADNTAEWIKMYAINVGLPE